MGLLGFLRPPPPPPPLPVSDDLSQLITSAVVISFACFAIYSVCFPRKHKKAAFSTAAAGTGSPQHTFDESPLPLSELGTAVRKLTEFFQEDQALDAGAYLLRLQRAIALHPRSSEAKAAAADLAKSGLDVEKIGARYADCQNALEQLGRNEGWVHAYEACLCRDSNCCLATFNYCPDATLERCRSIPSTRASTV